MKAHGAEEMNRRLLAAAEEAGPDLSFFVLFEDEIEPETIRGVSDAGGPAVNWFTDDHWRFDRFTRHFAPAFDWSITTDRDSLPKYEAIGYENVILSQWACNGYAYDWTGRELDVRRHVHRPVLWQAARNRRAPARRGLRRPLLGVRLAGGQDRARRDGPRVRREPDQPQPLERVLAVPAADAGPPPDRREGGTQEPDQGAHLRGPGQRRASSSPIDVAYLEDYLTPGEEIGVFESPDDLVAQVRWWLEHEDERAEAAEAGYRRVRAEHTYDHRFAEIFDRIGVS